MITSYQPVGPRGIVGSGSFTDTAVRASRQHRVTVCSVTRQMARLGTRQTKLHKVNPYYLGGTQSKPPKVKTFSLSFSPFTCYLQSSNLTVGEFSQDSSGSLSHCYCVAVWSGHQHFSRSAVAGVDIRFSPSLFGNPLSHTHNRIIINPWLYPQTFYLGVY